ncbi:hypothetical protein OG21DRAFT_1490501 [Imleria badia]|nr:hypothetical protein OG21DRAFT_1490501 [Imleria badia]
MEFTDPNPNLFSTHTLTPMADTAAAAAAQFLLTGAALHPFASSSPGTLTPMQPYYPAWASPAQPESSPQLAAPVAAPVIKQEQLTLRCTGPQVCTFSADPTYFMSSCPHVDAYIQSGRATRGSDNHIHLPDGRHIPHIPGTNCLKDCLDWLAALAATPIVSSAITTGLFSLTYPDTNTMLDIDLSVFWSSIHHANDCNDDDSALEHPDFQSYITQVLANFKADKDKGKRPHFDGVHMPPCIPQPALVAEEIVSPAIKAVRTTPTASSSCTAPAPAASQPPPPPTTTKSNVPICFEPTNNALPAPTGQFRYSCPIEDETAPRRILDWVLETTVPIPVKDLLSVALEFHKQLRELATTKHIPVTSNVVQVNELSGCDPGAID